MINQDSIATFGQPDRSNTETLHPQNIVQGSNNQEALLPKSMQSDSGATAGSGSSSQKTRIHCLDVYRGLTMLGMILVDYLDEDREGATWWLIHPKWNGFTPADLIFPAFLFIMGIAVPIATSKTRPIRTQNVIRVFLLFLIGLALNLIDNKLDFSTLRIPGILQRLAICYGLTLLIHWLTEYGTNIIKRMIGALFMIGLVILYLGLVLSWSDESIGCSREHNLQPFCNFVGYVDRAIFTQDHILEKTDPQGVMSNIPAAFTTYVGYWFGLMLVKLKGEPERLIRYWLTISLVFLLPVYPASLLMPLNKRLYGISFLFLVLSISAVTLSILLFLLDILPKIYKKSANAIRTATQPLTWLGLNPLAIFVIMQVTSMILNNWITFNDDQTPYSAFYEACFSWMTPSVGTAAYSFLYALLFTLVAGLLYKYKIFVRL